MRAFKAVERLAQRQSGKPIYSVVRRRPQRFKVLLSFRACGLNNPHPVNGMAWQKRYEVGDHTAGVTPVPIPNTAVKPRWADCTARVTVWESR